MKNLLTLLVFLLSSILSYSQSISYVYPSEGRRNQNIQFYIDGNQTQFLGSSSFTVTLKSNVDQSIITSSDFEAWDDTYLSGAMFIPATAQPGLYSLSVQTSNQGKLTVANAFTVTNMPPLPEITMFTPTSANHGEEVSMTVNVQYGQLTTQPVYGVNLTGSFTSLSAESFDVVNDSTLVAIFNIPLGSQSDLCNLNVVTTNDYLNSQQYFTINGLNPEIVSISPNSASSGDHVDITIHTTQTIFTGSNPDVYLRTYWGDYYYATLVTVVNDSELVASFDIPANAYSSLCDLVIYTGQMSFSAYEVFTINGVNPRLLSISPAEGEQGSTMDVTITGEDMFFTQASYFNVLFYGDDGGYFYGSYPVVLSDNQIQTTLNIPANAPLGIYRVDVEVNGQYFTLWDDFSVVDDGIPDPALVSISPSEAQRGHSLDVTITGAGTHFTQASSFYVSLSGFDYIPAASYTVINDTKLSCHFDLPIYAQKGLYDVVVSDGNSNLILEQSFSIIGLATDPRLVSISPAMTFPGQTLDITITGANTHFMTTSTTLDMAIFSQVTYIQPTTFVVTSSTTIDAHFEMPDDFPLGIYDFGLISDIDGFLVLIQSVIVNAVGLDENEKVITNLYPNPVHDKLYIDTKYPVRACTIVDITGKQTVVDPNEFKQDNTHIIVPIDKLGLRKGIYFIRLESDSGFDYKKFIVE